MEENPSVQPSSRRWLCLAVILVAAFMDLLDVTIVNVAIPSIQADLDATYAEIEWVVASYVLALAAVLITGGRLGDTFGRKRVFLLGMAGFTIASAVCGMAADPTVLIAARFLQGAMAALMVPQILAIIHVTFPPEERGKVFGMYGAIAGAASVGGLILGGLLVDLDLFGLGWRPIFLVNVPVGVAALIAAWRVVPESRSSSAPKPDLAGMAIATTAILLLVYPLAEGRSLGWPWWTFLMMGGSVPMLACFVAYERWRTRSVGSPLVALGLFRARSFTSGMAVWLIFWIALGGFFLVWTLYLQVGLGWSPLRAGLTASAFAIGAGVAAGLSVEVLTPRLGRGVLMVGALLNAGGFGFYLWATDHYGPAIGSWQMVGPLVVVGFGFGLVVAPMIDLILSDVPVHDAGSASGLLNTTQQVGMAIGVALVSVLFFALLEDRSDHGVDRVAAEVRARLGDVGVPAADQRAILAGFRACVHDRSAATDPTDVPASCRQPGDQRVVRVLAEAGAEANAHNFSRAFGLTLGYEAGTLLLVFTGMFGLPRRLRTRDIDAELDSMERAPQGARRG